MTAIPNYKHGVLQFIVSYFPLLLPLIIYLPFAFAGYGVWDDSYTVINAGKKFLETGVWTPSRPTGFFVYELSVMVLNYIGGSILSNLGTITMALLAIHSFVFICERFEIPHYKLLAIIMIIHPVFWINSTSVADHVWAIGFMLGGFMLFLKKRYGFAGLLLGLAVGSRITIVAATIGILLFVWLTDKNGRKQIAISASICGVLSILFYLPSFIYADYNFNFLTTGQGGPELWTPLLRIGRFIYKNIYFWGLPAFIALIVIIIAAIKERKNFFESKWFAISSLSIAMIISYELLYLKYPMKIAYLLPILPFTLILLGIGLKNKRRLLIIFSALVFSYNFIKFDTAKPDVPGSATDAFFKFTIEEGYLINDTKTRLYIYNSYKNGSLKFRHHF